MTDRTKGIAQVRRRILRDREAVLAVGDFEDLFAAYHAHVRRWDLVLDDLGTVMMHQALAGAALQLSFRRPEETSAWTVNVDRPPANLFVTGGSRDDVLTGRYFMDGVETIGESRLFVQRTHPSHDLAQSVLTVEGLDVLEIYEQFFARSEQVPSRFLELSSNEMVMVQLLPGGDPAWIDSLDATAVRELITGAGEDVEHRNFRFHCGCDGARMARTMVAMFRRSPEELFQGDPGVEAACPRCGSRWWIDRELFDRTALADGEGSLGG
jgi:hypothetical protein